MNPLFQQIANDYLGIETLETQNSDSLDFHEVSVWGVLGALEAAFNAGKENSSINNELVEALKIAEDAIVIPSKQITSADDQRMKIIRNAINNAS